MTRASYTCLNYERDHGWDHSVYKNITNFYQGLKVQALWMQQNAAAGLS